MNGSILSVKDKDISKVGKNLLKNNKCIFALYQQIATIMNQEPQKTASHGFKNRFFNTEPSKIIDSIKAMSMVFSIFSLLFALGFFYKITQLPAGTASKFRLPVTGIDILPLYHSQAVSFWLVALYETLALLVMALAFFYFMKFMAQLDKTNPFKNPAAARQLQRVSFLGIVFFALHVVTTIHLQYFQELLGMSGSISDFKFEYLFLVYFIAIFSFIFKRGVALNSEMDLVI